MLRRLRDDERGVTTVMFGLLIPTFLLFCVFAVDVGNWFVHKRHLQTQADAAALAGAGAFRFPSCDNGLITDAALRYSGKGDGSTTYNEPELVNTEQARLHAVVNGPNYYAQSIPNDADLADSPVPCEAKMIDVKMTETDLPWFFGTGLVPNINAQARVQLFKQSQADKLLPIGVQEPAPNKAVAYVVDEVTGATLGTVPLQAKGTSDGLQRFSNTDAPLQVKALSTVSRLGVRVTLSGSDSTTCDPTPGPLVACYDSAAATGLSYIRAWSDEPDVVAEQAPRARSVYLSPGTCGNASFNSNSTACTMDVSAKVSWQPAVQQKHLSPPYEPADKPEKATLTVTYNGLSYPMTYDATTTTWTAKDVTVPAGTIGPRNVEIAWVQENVGSYAGNACTSGNGNKCKGTITEGGSTALQRTFWNNPKDQASRAGPIAELDVLDASTTQQVSDVRRCSVADLEPVCTYNFVIDVGVRGSLELSDENDPPVALRVDENMTQSLLCDPDEGTGAEAVEATLAKGCGPAYKINEGETCPGRAALWATDPAWPCVAIKTGPSPNTTPRGLNTRILCNPIFNEETNCENSGSAKVCTHPNKWPDYELDDPRLVQVYLTPFGTFTGTGADETVPVIGFASFYITGYTGEGGVKTPCADLTGDDADDYAINPPPKGHIAGHFVTAVQPNTGGAGTEECDFDAIYSCIAVLVK